MSWEHNHDTYLSAMKVCEKEKEVIEEATRNPIVSPRMVLGNLSVNLTTQNVNAVSWLRYQATLKKKKLSGESVLNTCGLRRDLSSFDYTNKDL